APGIGLYSAYLGSNYKTKDGTSEATPLVAAAIALLRQAFPNARLTDLQTALVSTAADLGVAGRDNRYGWGGIDVRIALGALTTNMVNVALTVTRSNNRVILS